MLVIDVDGIDRLRCLMGMLLGARTEDNESCARHRWRWDRASGCTHGWVMLINISTSGARLACMGASIVFGFDTAGVVAAVGRQFRDRFHCRCDMGCTVGSLVA